MEKDFKGHFIRDVRPGSIAEEVGIEPMDRLIAINDQEIKDICYVITYTKEVA